ncbi:outer membrane beta-barrel protein [Marinobacter salicampi]|uniref:outer membrane beta-barrel protein n=1 Tax=Marinobacter salicampi TaxID=435907 RepID=UPI001409A55A|nr:outer membrane beta-barrel protein [Marinobacter salicampi]
MGNPRTSGKALFSRGAAETLALTTLSISVLTFSGAASVSAEPVKLSAGLENIYSDNVRLRANNEESDMETRLSVNVNHVSDPGRCNSRLGGEVGVGYWWESTYDPELYTDLGFRGDCEITRGLDWEVSNSLRDVQTDSREAATPDNTSSKNVFTTGPVYTLPITKTDVLSFSAKYQRTDYFESQGDDDNQVDGQRVIGSASWNHLFSSTLSAGLRVSTDRAELENDTEIDKNTASVIFSNAWPATQISGSVGVTELETRFTDSSRPPSNTEAFVGNVSLDRQINPSADFYLNVRRDVTDQTSDFDIEVAGFSFNLRETEVIEVTTVNTGINKRFGDSTNLNVEAFASRSLYVLSDVEEDRIGLEANVVRPIATRWNGTAGAGYTYLTYDENQADDTLADVYLGLLYKASSQLNIQGRIGHNRRTSDVPSREYQENWILLGLEYRFF